MLPLSLAAMKGMALMLKFNVLVAGYKFNPVEKQAKHPSRLTAKITEEMIADEDETDSIWMKIQDNMEMRKRRTITLQKTIDETRKV